MAELRERTSEEGKRVAAAIGSDRQVTVTEGKHSTYFNDDYSKFGACDGTSIPAKSISDENSIKRDSRERSIDFKPSAAEDNRSIGNAGSCNGSAGNIGKCADILIYSPNASFQPHTLLSEHGTTPNPNEHFVYLLDTNNNRRRSFGKSYRLSYERRSS